MSKTTPCMLALLVSCGKKIDSTNDDDIIVTRPGAESSSINLKVQTNNSNTGKKTLVTEQSGWAKIPDRPIILKSISNIIYSKISFNIESTYEHINKSKLVCDYISTIKSNIQDLKDMYNHQFIGCKEDIDGDDILDDLNYQPGDEIALENNQKIQFEVNSSDRSDQLNIEADIEVDWR